MNTVFLPDPAASPWTTYASALVEALNLGLVSAPPESLWRRLAAAVSQAGHTVGLSDVPDPTQYATWQAWAQALKQANFARL